MVLNMNTKLTRLQSDLIYHPVPHCITGASNIAKYIREQFNATYYLSRILAEHVIEHRQEEREKLKERKRKHEKIYN